MANAIAQVAHTFPGAPLHSPAYQTADGSMPFALLLAYIALLPAALAMDRLNLARAYLIADGGEQGETLQREAFEQAYPEGPR